MRVIKSVLLFLMLTLNINIYATDNSQDSEASANKENTSSQPAQPSDNNNSQDKKCSSTVKNNPNCQLPDQRALYKKCGEKETFIKCL